MARRSVYLYLITLSSEIETFSKIGISVHKFCRFYQIMNFGYACNIEYMIRGCDYSKFHDLEVMLHRLYSNKQYTPYIKFGGHTECFKGIVLSEYIETLRELYPINCDVIKNTHISWR